ncbi:hypothetical protein DFQ30_004068, partial [Apophysomyces sp. BC1015]
VKEGKAQSVSDIRRDPSEDVVLSQAIDLLKSVGGRCLKDSSTPPGYGFHYHNLQVKA